MSSQVIALLEGHDHSKKIELTEEMTCIVFGSDRSCKDGYIRKNNGIALFHCRIYLQRSETQEGWDTYIQDKAVNTKKYVTYVNNCELKTREKKRLCDNANITIGKEKEVSFVFHDVFNRNEEAKMKELPEIISNQFKNGDGELGRAHIQMHILQIENEN